MIFPADLQAEAQRFEAASPVHRPDSGVRSLEIRLLELSDALTDSVLWGQRTRGCG